MNLVPDSVDGGIAGFGARLRRRETTAEATLAAYLARIDMLDSSLGAYEHVDRETAMATARAIDALLRAGTDLGPLMGVPVAVKDIIVVEDMPTSCGSVIDVADLLDAEGEYIGSLRRSGAVIFGKTRTVEFATGNTGLNLTRGSPRNPWDTASFRVSSGSSSGSAVAVAAGLCGFAVGTDTGGSIRGPAGYCGIFGMRPSPGLWSTGGMFHMSPTLDTIGPMTKTASDAAIVFAALEGSAVPAPADLRGVVFGRPADVFFDGLDAAVTTCIERALSKIREAGASIVETEVPEAAECDELYNTISRAEAIATLGRTRFQSIRHRLNPDVAMRMAPGLDVTAEAYIRAIRRSEELGRIARRRLAAFDGWIAPTKKSVAPACDGDPWAADHAALAHLCGGPTRQASIFGMCAASLPVHQLGSPLPVGLQLICPAGEDAKMLSIATAIENAVGPAPRPELDAFIASKI